MIAINTTARTGAKSETTDVTTDPPSSAVAKTGLANPPVLISEAPRKPTVDA